jgi:hypothetical protein
VAILRGGQGPTPPGSGSVRVVATRYFSDGKRSVWGISTGTRLWNSVSKITMATSSARTYCWRLVRHQIELEDAEMEPLFTKTSSDAEGFPGRTAQSGPFSA